jgi:hypothetical protein
LFKIMIPKKTDIMAIDGVVGSEKLLSSSKVLKVNRVNKAAMTVTPIIECINPRWADIKNMSDNKMRVKPSKIDI